MKRTVKRGPRKLELRITSWASYIEWTSKLEKLLREKPRTVQIDIVGSGEMDADDALLIRAALLKRSPRTRIVANARSTLQGGTVMIWLLADQRTIADDAQVFFRRADLPEDAEVDPNADWKALEPKYVDSFSEVDPDEGDYARVLKVINEYLPAREFAGKLIGLGVLKQFGLIENERVDGFLANVFARANSDAVARR